MNIGLAIGIPFRTGGGAAGPLIIYDGNTVGFWDFTDVTKITKDGSNRVSEVTPIIGTVPLKQNGADDIKPVWDSDGLTFDGVRQYIETDNITLDHPIWTYIVFKQVTWTAWDVVMDGKIANTNAIWQRSSSPLLAGYGGGSTVLGNSSGLNIGNWGICRLLNTGSYYSRFIINNLTPFYSYIADVGAASGLTIGRKGSTDSNYSNIKVKAILQRKVQDSLHDSRDIYNYLNTKYSIDAVENDPVTSNAFDNGKLLITFDDSLLEQYTQMFPLLQAQGVAATFYEISGGMGGVGMCTWANLLDMHNNGMDIQCHYATGNALTGNTIAANIVLLNEVSTAFIANGLPSPVHHAYPIGSYSTDVITAVSSVRLTGRTYIRYEDYQFTYSNTDKYQLHSLMLDVITIAQLKAMLDEAKVKKCAIITTAHGAGIAFWNEIIDYAQSIGIDIITISELYALME